MAILPALYRPSLALLTDLYQLTMAYGYWRSGVADHRAVFHLSFRNQPFGGGYSIACGIAYGLELIEHLRFDESDLAYLATLNGGDEKPLFHPDFLSYLSSLRISCDVDAVEEGTAVFPHEPLLRVEGPIIECQLLETALLNVINFQTLIATKASRVALAARGEPVLEFGLRRAQSIDGGLSASRAAYVGGCASTSNVMAGKLFGIPVAGTHAHSWVMFFDDEREAFLAYAKALPNNCVFLVDTYDTLDGVRHAVETGRWLREHGHALAGVRLDSGDLAWLSIEARKILDEGGFPDARIYASNDLDEHVINSLKEQGAAISVWGVGTRLVTAYDQPALGGVYKLSSVRRPGGAWIPKVKVSSQPAKTSTPGVLNVRRYRDAAGFLADEIYDRELGPSLPVSTGAGERGEVLIIDPFDPTSRRRIADGTAHEDLLVPMLRGGRRVYEEPPLSSVRARAAANLAQLHPSVRRFLNPQLYPVGLEQRLHALRTRLVLDAREASRV